MSLLDELKKKLDTDTFNTVVDALGDGFNFDLVPRSRLNNVIAQRNSLRTQLESQSSGSGSPKPDDDDDDDTGVDVTSKPGKVPQSGTGFTQADIDKAVQAEREAGEAKVRELQLRYAITAKLREAKFADPDLVLSAGLVDLSKVKTDKSGAITGGLDDQIKAIAEARPFLVSAGVSSGTGKAGDSGNFSSVTSMEDFLKLSYDKQMEFKSANPEVFKGFMSQF